MFASSLTVGVFCALLPQVAQVRDVDRQTVVIEAPGISCMGRFTDSVNQHIVKKHDWVHGVSIRYATDRPVRPRRLQGHQKFVGANEPLLIGGLAIVRFEIDKNVAPNRLAALLKSSGYYNTDGWTLIERVPFSAIGSTRKNKADR